MSGFYVAYDAERGAWIPEETTPIADRVGLPKQWIDLNYRLSDISTHKLADQAALRAYKESHRAFLSIQQQWALVDAEAWHRSLNDVEIRTARDPSYVLVGSGALSELPIEDGSIAVPGDPLLVDHLRAEIPGVEPVIVRHGTLKRSAAAIPGVSAVFAVELCQMIDEDWAYRLEADKVELLHTAREQVVAIRRRW